MKIKGYVVEELPDSCGECQFLEVMMGDDETWCFCRRMALLRKTSSRESGSVRM